MSRTNIEFLFQVTGTAGDRGGCCQLPRAEELFPPFNDHLSKAASTVLNGASAAARPGDRLAASDSASNGNGASKDSSQSEAAPAANATADDRDDTETDKSCSLSESSTTETNNEPIEASAEADDDGNSDKDTTDNGNADELAQAAVSAIEANVGENAAAVATKVAIQEPATAVEGATQNESPADPTNKQASAGDAAPKQFAADMNTADVTTDESLEAGSETSEQIEASGKLIKQPESAKTGKKSTNSKFAATTENDAHADRDGLSGNRDVAIEVNGDASVQVEAVEPADESSNAEEPLNELAQSNESQSASDEPRRDASVRSAGRQHADAEAVVNKVATTAVANSMMPQPRDDAAATESADKTAPAKQVGGTKTDELADAANRLQASRNAAKGGSLANSANELPRVDPARFVSRVAKAFHTAQERGGTLQLRLSPPELGAMRLELTVKDGVMTAALETETAAARRVLLEHLPALRDRLAEQNIRVERFDVDVRREGSGGQADPRAPQDRQPPQQEHTERRQPAMQQRESAAPQHIAPVAQPLTDNTGINLVA